MTSHQEEECWKPMTEGEGRFLISSWGRLISVYERVNQFRGSKIENGKRQVITDGCKRVDRIREFKPRVVYGKSGKIREYKISYRNSSEGRVLSIAIGLSVARYFLPNPLGRTRIAYKDGNLTNCKVSNLEWRGGNQFTNKEEYIKHLRTMDVGERKSTDICNAIVEYLEGNDSKMEEILQKNRRVIYWKIYNIVQRHDTAEDLTQESMYRIYKKINELLFHYPKNPVGWFVRIAQNLTRNYVSRVSGVKEVGMDFDRLIFTTEGKNEEEYGEEECDEIDYASLMESNRPAGWC